MFGELFISLQGSASSLGNDSHGLRVNMGGAETNSSLPSHILWLFLLFVFGKFAYA